MIESRLCSCPSNVEMLSAPKHHLRLPCKHILGARPTSSTSDVTYQSSINLQHRWRKTNGNLLSTRSESNSHSCQCWRLANTQYWEANSVCQGTESKQIKLFLARAEIRKRKHVFSAKSLILGLPIKTSIPIKPRGSGIPIDPKYPKDLSDQVFSLSLGCTCRVAGTLDGIGWHSICISRASQGKHGRCTNAFFERPPVFT